VNIPGDSHFCCLALNGPRLRHKQEHLVAPGLTVGNAQDAFELEPHWIEWLGTIQADSFRESSLFVTAVVDKLPTKTGAIPIHERLDNRVRLFHHVLVMLGCGYNNNVLMVGGEKFNRGVMHIGPVRSGLTPCFRPSYRKARPIEMNDLEKAALILSNLELIYRQVPGLHVSERLYRRLRKGFNVWIRGAQEGEELIERFHSFIRATEAILKPTIARKRSEKTRKRLKGKNWRDVTPTFIHRGQTIIGDGPKNERLLRQLYDIRSSIEHIKDIMPAVKRVRGVARDETFGFRALQAEVLASRIYSQILGNPALLKIFSTETSVEAFWRRNPTSRRKLWGEPMDLESEAHGLFHSRTISDF
jgi:hypothetical protein